jgi:hypothetical protein
VTSATVNATGIGASEIVSIATDILILVVIVLVLAHQNMIHMQRNVDELNWTERRASGTVIAPGCLHTVIATVGRLIVTSVLAAVLVVTTTVLSAVNAKLNVSGRTLVGPIRAKAVSAYWTTVMVLAALLHLGVGGTVTKAQASAIQRYVW